MKGLGAVTAADVMAVRQKGLMFAQWWSDVSPSLSCCPRMQFANGLRHAWLVARRARGQLPMN